MYNASQDNKNKTENKPDQKKIDTSIIASNKKILCAKATKSILKWLEVNEIICYKLYFDERIISPVKNIFLLRARAIDTFNNTAYIFETSSINDIYNLTYITDTKNPHDLLPGDIGIKITPHTKQTVA